MQCVAFRLIIEHWTELQFEQPLRCAVRIVERRGTDSGSHHQNWSGVSPRNNFEQESPADKLAHGEMQYAIALEMKYKRLRYSHTLSRPPFCPPSWNVQSDLCQNSTTDVRCHYAQFSEKRSLYIDKWLRYSPL